MPPAILSTDDLLGPISDDQPGGVSMRWTPEWDRIKEARRADDTLDAGQWAKKERKTANWPLVQELAASMLQTRSKDLQIALWLTEANVKLHGFAGLRDGFRLVRELMVRYWDNGVYPSMEDGPEDRSAPFEWLNDKLVDSILSIPITKRSDSGKDYGLVELKDARRVGSEAACMGPDGDIDPQKKKEFDRALAAGRPSMDMFNQAVAETKLAAYEELSSTFAQAYDEFKQLERIVEDKFGEVAPSLAACRAALSEIDAELSKTLDKKRNEQQKGSPASASAHVDPIRPQVTRFKTAGLPPLESSTISGSSWHQAEALVRSGQVDAGLAEMARLAASETTGRNRFQRKLLLAEICLSSNRERLARVVLEELAEQIDKFQLEIWESSDLVGAVWARLYGLYSHGDSSDVELAGKLYERLCRLDPWQALACE